MALSLSSERSLPAASPANPFVAFARWIVAAQANRKRRAALKAMLDLDPAMLVDMGVSRQDVLEAIDAPVRGGSVLHAARARNARR